MNRDGELLWRARALVGSPEDSAGPAWGAPAVATARRWAAALRPVRDWLRGLDRFREETGELLQNEAARLSSLTIEEVTWGYGPGDSPWTGEPAKAAAPRPRRVPGALRDAALAGAEPGSEEIAEDLPSPADPVAATASSFPRESPDSRPVGEKAGVRADAPVSREARERAAAWWAERCAVAARGPSTPGPLVVLESTGDSAARVDPEPSVLIPADPDDTVPTPPRPAAPPAGNPAANMPASVAGAVPDRPLRPLPAAPRAEDFVGDWPPPLAADEPGPATTRPAAANPTQPEEPREAMGDPPRLEGASRSVDLRASRGGSLGRIPVDMDPSEAVLPAATIPGETADHRETERVRWLKDDDDLAGRLHELLRRQARRRGIELS